MARLETICFSVLFHSATLRECFKFRTLIHIRMKTPKLLGNVFNANVLHLLCSVEINSLTTNVCFILEDDDLKSGFIYFKQKR